MVDYNQIEPGIYLGGIRTARNLNELKKLRISSILTADIMPLPDEIILNMRNYLHVNINDNPRSNLIENLDSTYNFIQKCLDQKEFIYIHCVAGISRSSSILIAYFMKSRKLNFKDAFELVSRRRELICPNAGFREQLILYGLMNGNLDINCGQYRIFQLTKLTQSINQYLLDITNPQSISNFKLDLNNYLTKFHDISKLIKPKIIFKCKNCRLYLFRDINVLTNRDTSIQNSSAENSDLIEFCNNIVNSKCGNIYVEPLIWMNDISQVRGNLICKHCFNKIGKFCWLGINCSDDCLKHRNIVPSFKIDSKKIDHHIL